MSVKIALCTIHSHSPHSVGVPECQISDFSRFLVIFDDFRPILMVPVLDLCVVVPVSV